MSSSVAETGGNAAAKSPRLSVIVVVYDMQREAPRTLRSLTCGFQNDIDESDYEIVVVDNGSPVPLGEDSVRQMGANFRYLYIEKASTSPAAAVNLGASLCSGGILGILVDGARIASPGLLRTALHAFSLHADPVVATLGWHIGPLSQQQSVPLGYDKLVEDELLDGVGWPESHYRLFSISSFAQSSRDGLFAIPAESNGVFVSRRLFDELSGYDEAFDLPGGGFVNHDFFRRAVERPGNCLIVPLGEGTFHQVHGGVSTNAAKQDLQAMVKVWNDQYTKIRGREYEVPNVQALYLGPVRVEQNRQILHSVLFANKYYKVWQLNYVVRAWILIRVLKLKYKGRQWVMQAARRAFHRLPFTETHKTRLKNICDRYFRWLYVKN